MEPREYIRQYIGRAARALEVFEGWDQAGVDLLCRTAARTVFDNAEELARMAVDETGMGNYEDKVRKNRGKASIIWNSLKGKPSVGILRTDGASGITEVARPVGIIAAVTPCTNPVVTPMCNALFSLKGRNAVIFTPHHRAIRTSTRTVELINRALAEKGAPEHLIQILDEQSRENTRALMEAAHVVVATGGSGMVRAAYSSGRPAFGVGAGNVQCIVDADADPDTAARKILEGRAFDNGIICSGEQSVIVRQDRKAALMAAFRKIGGYPVPDNRIPAVREVLFPEGKMNPLLVGQPVSVLADMADLPLPPGTRVLLLDALGPGRADVLGREKMCPVLSVYTWESFDEAVEIAAANLEEEGKGHTVAIHSDNRENIEAAACRLPASRFVVNQSCSTSAGGSFFNGFAPTTTLGCGSWGNNSLSENLNYTHFLNISRIGYPLPGGRVPSDRELWEEE